MRFDNPSPPNRDFALTAVDRAYRLAALGDSRARSGSSGTAIGYTGSGTLMEMGRFPAWTAAYLKDADMVADFSVGGDTLISSSSSTGWNGYARSNGKTLANLLAVRPDAVLIQYGINDLPSASSANLIAAAQSMVSKLVASGIKVLLQNIMIFDPTAGSANISPANAAATLVKINAFRDAMSAWMAPMAGRAIFVDPNPLLVDGSGYGDPQYFTTADAFGIHPNKRGAQIMGKQAADALRELLPARRARAYTTGPLSQPNLIDWALAAASNTYVANSQAGTTTSGTVTWNLDPDTGVPYVEVTITPTVLASGRALARVEVWATDVSGATPKHQVNIGDVLQGSARVVIDNGSGGLAALQSVNTRHRLFTSGYTSQFFGDWGGVAGTDLTTLPLVVDGRFTTAMCVSPVASTSIQAATAGGGYYFCVFVETTALDPIRVRIYAPSLRVVSRAQPTSVTAGASPYTWTNNPQPFVANDWVNTRGRRAQVTVAPGSGGTISQIALTRGPSTSGTFSNPVNTGLSSGVFIVEPGDGLIVTWATTAAVLTVMYLDD